MINLKSIAEKCISFANLQRSNLVWAMFGNVGLPETAV